MTREELKKEVIIWIDENVPVDDVGDIEDVVQDLADHLFTLTEDGEEEGE